MVSPQRALANDFPKNFHETGRTGNGRGGVAESDASRARIALPWLAQLQWWAVAGQLVALLSLPRVSAEPLPVAGLAALLAVTTAGNLLLGVAVRRAVVAPERLLGGALVLDTVLLTFWLSLTGGADNPFALLYAIPVAIAAIGGGARWAWLLAVLVVSGYASSFRWFHPTHLWHVSVEIPGAGVLALHLAGMWVSMLIVTVSCAYFIQRLMAGWAVHESALRDARDRLARTEHLAALTTLAAGAAHDMASPLGTVAVVARELERSAGRGDPRAIAEDAALIRDEVDRCREILDRMAIAVQADRESHGRSRKIEDVWEILSAELGAEMARIRLDPSTPVRSLPISAVQLAPLLMPLVRNALDATPGPHSSVRVRFEALADGVRVEVSDDGDGMSPSVLERAREPFFTTKSERGGAGLGLHLVAVIAEALGGTLSLDSSPGGGTRAALTLQHTLDGGDVLEPGSVS